MLLIFCSIISTSVFGSDFKGNVLLKFPREVVNMENGQREISEPKVDIPITSDYWSPPISVLENGSASLQGRISMEQIQL